MYFCVVTGDGRLVKAEIWRSHAAFSSAASRLRRLEVPLAIDDRL
jgi:hypothetical protein